MGKAPPVNITNGTDESVPVTLTSSDQIGALTETAPASDTASSGLNGRLQRIAQRLTSLIALLTRPATSAVTSVNDSASNQTLLASNANRLGATVTNDSTQILYVKLGATATATSYTVRMLPGDYYEVPFGYTGIIDGIWAADASGAARVTELTA